MPLPRDVGGRGSKAQATRLESLEVRKVAWLCLPLRLISSQLPHARTHARTEKRVLSRPLNIDKISRVSRKKDKRRLRPELRGMPNEDCLPSLSTLDRQVSDQSSDDVWSRADIKRLPLGSFKKTTFARVSNINAMAHSAKSRCNKVDTGGWVKSDGGKWWKALGSMKDLAKPTHSSSSSPTKDRPVMQNEPCPHPFPLHTTSCHTGRGSGHAMAG